MVEVSPSFGTLNVLGWSKSVFQIALEGRCGKHFPAQSTSGSRTPASTNKYLTKIRGARPRAPKRSKKICIEVYQNIRHTRTPRGSTRSGGYCKPIRSKTPRPDTARYHHHLLFPAWAEIPHEIGHEHPRCGDIDVGCFTCSSVAHLLIDPLVIHRKSRVSGSSK